MTSQTITFTPNTSGSGILTFLLKYWEILGIIAVALILIILFAHRK